MLTQLGFGVADRDGKLVTRRIVAERPDRALCPQRRFAGAACAVVPSVTVSRVWRAPSRWQTDVTRTRLLARR